MQTAAGFVELSRRETSLAAKMESIDAMLQKEPGEGEAQTDIILLTHLAIEGQVNEAIRRIEALPTVVGKVTKIRLEELN